MENCVWRGGKESRICEFLCLPTHVFGDGLWRRGLIARLRVGESKTVQISGALQGVRNVRANIFGADVTFEVGLLHELGGLLAGTAEQQGTAGVVKLGGKIFDWAKAGGGDAGHVAQRQNQYGRPGAQRTEHLS